MVCYPENDIEVWNSSDIHPEDLWIFDKLIVSKKLGYVCGPKGISVPSSGYYIVRPCVNVLGMGRGAEIRWLDAERDTSEQMPDGFFWCQIFTGRHLSVDFCDEEQVLCVEGVRNESDPLWKWQKWNRIDDMIVPYPTFLLDQLKGHYTYINVEMINGNIIEVHLRRNPDFPLEKNYSEIIPVFYGSISEYDHADLISQGYHYQQEEYQDFHRIGYYYK